MKCQYLEVFVQHGAPEYLLKALRGITFHQEGRERSSNSSELSRVKVWAVLPFHPACRLVPFQGRLAQFIEDPSWKSAYAEAMRQEPPQISIAWANVFPTFACRLRHAAVKQFCCF